MVLEKFDAAGASVTAGTLALVSGKSVGMNQVRHRVHANHQRLTRCHRCAAAYGAGES
jgi:hypothetical protein